MGLNRMDGCMPDGFMGRMRMRMFYLDGRVVYFVAWFVPTIEFRFQSSSRLLHLKVNRCRVWRIIFRIKGLTNLSVRELVITPRPLLSWQEPNFGAWSRQIFFDQLNCSTCTCGYKFSGVRRGNGEKITKKSKWPQWFAGTQDLKHACDVDLCWDLCR